MEANLNSQAADEAFFGMLMFYAIVLVMVLVYGVIIPRIKQRRERTRRSVESSQAFDSAQAITNSP